MRLRSLVVAALLTTVVFSASGCGLLSSIAPKPIIHHVTIAAKVAKVGAKVDGTLKDGMPSDLPLWDGAGVLHAKVTKSAAGDSWLATLSTGDEYSAVVAGMATGFQQAGWAVEQQDVPSGDTSTTVLTVTGQKSTGVVTITGRAGKTTLIDYVMTQSK